MQRVRQIMAAGMFAWPIIYRGAGNWYNAMRKIGVKPADPFEPEDQNLIDPAVDLELAMKFTDDEYSSWVEMANLYLPESKKIDNRTAVPTLSGNRAEAGVTTASQLVSSLFAGDDELAPENWADAAQDPPRAVSGDAGATNVASLPTTSLARTGRARPKTAQEQADYDRQRRVRIEEKLASLARGARGAYQGNPGSHKNRVLLGEKAVALAKAFAEDAEQAEDVGQSQEDSAAASKRYYQDLEAELAGYGDEEQEEAFYESLAYETGIHVKALKHANYD